MNDRITKLDKLDALREEQLKRKAASGASSYFQQSLIDLNLEGGRYSGAGPNVIGRDPSAQYPAASSPWTAQADPGVEAPLGYSVNDLEPTGEAHEVAASIANKGRLELHASRVDQQSSDVDRGSGLPAELEVDQDAVTCPKQCGTGVASSTSIPLAENRRSSGLTPAVVLPGLAVSSPPASLERRSRPSPSAPDQPDDGLDVERRADGMPLSSHAVEPTTNNRMRRRKI